VNVFAWPASFGFLEAKAINADKVKITAEAVSQSAAPLRFEEDADGGTSAAFRFSNGASYDNDLGQRAPLILKVDLKLAPEDAQSAEVWERLQNAGAVNVTYSLDAPVSAVEPFIFPDVPNRSVIWITDDASVTPGPDGAFAEIPNLYCLLAPGASAGITVSIQTDEAGYTDFLEAYDTAWLKVFGTNEEGAETLSFSYSMTAEAAAQAFPYDKQSLADMPGFGETDLSNFKLLAAR
jgi:hypothetical protein